MDAGPLAKYTGQLVTKLKVTLVTPQLSPPRCPQALSTPRPVARTAAPAPGARPAFGATIRTSPGLTLSLCLIRST